jgi:flagellar biosynthesis protein FlhF
MDSRKDGKKTMAGSRKSRRFTGKTPTEALARAKAELGEDAVLVEQREVVELVVESSGDEAEASAPRGNPQVLRAYGIGAGDGPAEDDDAGAAVPAGDPAMAGISPDALADIQARLDELQKLTMRSNRPAVPEPLIELYMHMLDNEVSEELARHLVEALNRHVDVATLRDRAAIRGAMLKAVARLIPGGGGIRISKEGHPAVVMLVGPTGVGKSTSIAKLAMQFKVKEGKKVGLVTEDTSRPGGEEQLRAVARLLNLPMIVADTVERMRQAINRLQGCDVILIDTAGRVPRNRESLEELRRFVDEIEPDEVHLALCSCSCTRHLLDVIERFEIVQFDRILFTKLDEATTYGIILNVAAHVDRELSYVTTGQDYMENIETSDPGKIAALILRHPQSSRKARKKS